MTDQQPRPGVPVPPDELIHKWRLEWLHQNEWPETVDVYAARKSAAWASDEQLRLCVEWARFSDPFGRGENIANMLEADMRPEPPAPSLKQQALELFSRPSRPASYDGPAYSLTEHQAKLVCRALKRLSDDN